MEIRDVVHGVITVETHELPILDSRPFQRLKQIKATGFAENSYPGATHTRFIHSLGAMETATQAWERIGGQSHPVARLGHSDYLRLRAALRMAALLHDIGHGPFSHTIEFAMPQASLLRIPGISAEAAGGRQATHEDYTIKTILDSSLTPILEKAVRAFGFTPQHVAALVDPEYLPADDFFKAKVSGGGPEASGGEVVDWFPLLHQLVSSELDCDRMDYLRRDSFHAGVSYGVFDAEWLLSCLRPVVQGGRAYLGFEHRAIYAFEDFLLSRFHMFLMVYTHHKTVIYDEMLRLFLTGPGCDYRLPTDIEEYFFRNDAELLSHLDRSQDPWARRIADRVPYSLLLETHSGIPTDARAQTGQEALVGQVRAKLRDRGIAFIESTSTSQLSKYYGREDFPIFVHYDNRLSPATDIPLEECTELFTRYSGLRSITRIYVAPESLAAARI